MDHFWKLSEVNEKQRIDAAFRIIFNLQRSKEQDDSEFKANLQYTLRRFVSGLASDRVTSRKGYFMGLVEILQVFSKEITIENVIEMIAKHLNVKGSKSVSNFKHYVN